MRLKAAKSILAEERVTTTISGCVESTDDPTKAIGEATTDSKDGWVEVSLYSSGLVRIQEEEGNLDFATQMANHVLAESHALYPCWSPKCGSNPTCPPCPFKSKGSSEK